MSNLISGLIEMKSRILQIMLLITLPFGSELAGRQIMSPALGERVLLFSDRNLYITGEQILFSALLLNGEEIADTLQSRVMYCELITPGGSKIAGDKFLIEDSRASGSVNVPADLMSGTYFLRAYTRYMRNYGPDSYSYIGIKVVNPQRNEVQETPSGNEVNESLIGKGSLNNSDNPLIIKIDKSCYTSRDSMHIFLEADLASGSTLRGLSLSVVPEESVSEGFTQHQGSYPVISDGYYNIESRGISITGRVTEQATGRPLPYKRVNLSILGKGKDFMAMHTDSAGRFFFSLPDYSGYRDLYLCPEKAAGPDTKILVDNDFCTAPVRLPSGKFELSEEEREVAYMMAVNAQLESYFSIDRVSQASADQGEDRAFYGTPDDILFLENYIELPTLEEYFNGLPTLVRVRKSKGEKYFKVLGTQAGLNNFDPLLLVDLVAVDDPARILEVSPSKISRIEVVNQLYVKGDETFGGIISIISRDGDFAGIDLPESGIFINYGFLAGYGNPVPHASLTENYPDTRNTLFWDPDLKLDNDLSAKISMTVSDMTGRFLIILNGVSAEGERIIQTFPFEVKK
jgi:hypothetical protein